MTKLNINKAIDKINVGGVAGIGLDKDKTMQHMY